MKRLQKFDFKLSRYQRPNQDWECGRADVCGACPLGPDANGGCRATAECKPAKQGDRWQCTRADSRGGKCAEGPRPDGSCCNPIPPCTPRRSVRARRQLAVLLVVGLTLGVVLALLGLSSGREAAFSPGPVIPQHAAGGISCASCHSAAQLSSEGWLLGAFKKGGQHADSALCLQCHNLGQQPRNPHGLPADELQRLTALIVSSGRAKAPASPHPDANADGQLACSTCHREHHVANAGDLRRIPEASCQTCHSARFESFAKGHPEFTNFPYERRTRINFDHTSHITTHFAAAASRGKAPAGCADCHVTDQQNRLMLVRGFEKSCAACHSETIARPGAAGVAVLRIPGFDPKFTKARAATLGRWPQDADGPLTPFMRVLLAADPAASAALSKLEDADLMSLSSADPEVAASAEKLAWAIKELLADLVVSGQDTIKKRLGNDSPDLAGVLPAEAPAAFTRADWWPDLLAEVAAHRAGQPLPAKVPAAKPAPATKPAAAKSDSGGDILGDDILADAPAKPAAKPAPKPAAATDDILGGDDIPSAPKPAAKPATKPASKDDSLGDDILAGDAAPAKPAAKPAPAVVAPKPVAPEKWLSSGGWYASDSDYSVRYRPVGHADPFLHAWQSETARHATTPAQKAVVAELLAAGSCNKCHSVDDAPGGGLEVNWHGLVTDSNLHKFTKFAHGTHFSLLSENGCATCHQLNPRANYAAAFKDGKRNPAVFASNFQTMKKSDCAACHQPEQAGNSCQLCHNYHIGTFAPTTTSGLPIIPADAP